ncbi:hypothetical protein FNV43_RR11315 [Rhamnella rubrinervis]|uniref:RING-type E3 ubiquitin transferase n=1 Tax=Rhamnella rubrinervis TaxID=2594499 RepID=A0A8K0MHI0_9ROSA|nr:hypothetical protein FNV43_RR11315 [Rhamnella rubrinervis]
MESEEAQLKQRLEELQRDLSKKQKFEDAVSSLKSLLIHRYSSASPSLRKLFYSVVCRLATVLKTRYTAPGFWVAGLGLFEQAQSLVSDASEKTHLQTCIAQAKEVLHQVDNPPELSQSNNGGYLFEGHLTVDQEPPQPQWLVQSNLLSAAALLTAESSQRPVENDNAVDNAASLLQSLVDNFDSVLPPILENERGAPRVPPASKEVVANLPVITINEEILGKLGKDAECAICKENLVVNDKMQELPCMHTFHPPCLKPWLDEHNSCPICRYELQTDDDAYERWKEQEREAEEERKGAANAIRGGEYICNEQNIAKKLMELATCCSSSPSSSTLFGTKFRCIFSPNITTKNKTIQYSVRRLNGWTKAMATGSPSSGVWNGHAGSGSYGATNTARNGNNGRNYTRMDSCLVIPPPNGKKPRAIIKFLGGAFIGAVPELTYSYLIELLAKDGFLIISVPYNVTFDHAHATKQVYERFNACLGSILSSGLPSANLTSTQLANLPIFSVGHSNGALLQVLTGSYFCDKIPKANAIISYNNRSATEAVPYFEQLGPLVRQMMPIVEASPVYSMARSASGDAWKVLVDAAGAMVRNNDQETLISLTKFVGQLPSVFDQVTQGISEFKPTPSENRDCFKNSYNVKHTLLVKFNFDTIDETDLLEQTLKYRVELIGGTLEKVQLSGNHITPCIQDPKWQAGNVYTPADAVAQGFKTLSLNETRVLFRTISDWFRRFEN